eukprot:SAG11_NODE_927_length_6519_cov_2.357788_2_plen_110_part_00
MVLSLHGVSRFSLSLLNSNGVRAPAGAHSVDGAGGFFWHQMRSMSIERPRLIEPMFVEELRVGPINLRQAAFWNLHPIYCEHVHIHDISIVATPGAALDAGKLTGSTPK